MKLAIISILLASYTYAIVLANPVKDQSHIEEVELVEVGHEIGFFYTQLPTTFFRLI